MRILLSNDDGYEAPGIVCLASVLASIADITVVAPDRNRSGASNSLTLDNPIRAQRMDSGFIRVNGTPTDCVHLAITGLLDNEPDMVISGINAGGNLGDDVLYSGTVAAAMEGRFLGYPALAVSLVGADASHYVTAAHVVVRLIRGLQDNALPADTILNVNVPDVLSEDIAGYQVTSLGHRHKSEPVIRAKDPRGCDIYWVGPPGSAQEEGPGTDFYALSHQYVSITPIHTDLTHHRILDTVSDWLEKIS